MCLLIEMYEQLHYVSVVIPHKEWKSHGRTAYSSDMIALLEGKMTPEKLFHRLINAMQVGKKLSIKETIQM